ncbi:unnamed protein product [Lampetra fluviatilis]
MSTLFTFMSLMAEACDCFLSDEALWVSVRSSGYEAILADGFNPCSSLVARRLSIPFVSVVPAGPLNWYEPGLPTPPSYVPMMMMGHTDTMGFAQRDLEDFVSGSGSAGFVLVSLGTVIAHVTDIRFVSAMSRALSRLPQRVVWKYRVDSYGQSVRRLSKIQRSLPFDPPALVTAWTRHVLTVGDGQHLQVRACELPFYQYYLLDVLALATTLLLLVVVATRRTWRLVKRLRVSIASGAVKKTN